MMLKAIGKRQHNEMAMQASFHGIKIPLRTESVESEPIRINSETEQKILRRAQERLRHG